MKILLTASAIFLISSNVLANSYCYDNGVFAVSRYEEAITTCKATYPIKSFDNLRKSLMKGTTKQALKASGALRLELDNATWSSNYSADEQRCIKKAINENQKEVDTDVLRSLELCL